DGSTEIELTWPAFIPLFWDPRTGVQMFWEVGLLGSWVNTRNPRVIRSATGSPRPVLTVSCGRGSDQLGNGPLFVPLFVTNRVHVPLAFFPASTLSGSWGL